VANACKGIDFTKKKDSFADSIISNIQSQRSGKGKVKRAVDNKEYLELLISLLQYCIPWLVLFILSLFFAYV
jgi:hypothetical protein